MAVGDCSVTERRRWRPPYQTGKTVHVHAKHYKHNADGRTAPGVCGNGSVPLSHSGNVVTRIGIHTHTLKGMVSSTCVFNYFFLALSLFHTYKAESFTNAIRFPILYFARCYHVSCYKRLIFKTVWCNMLASFRFTTDSLRYCFCVKSRFHDMILKLRVVGNSLRTLSTMCRQYHVLNTIISIRKGDKAVTVNNH